MPDNQDLREVDWLSRLILTKFGAPHYTTCDVFKKHVHKIMSVRLQNDSAETHCTLAIDHLAWDTTLSSAELIDMFKDVRNPIERVHAVGCLHSAQPDIVIQYTHTGSMAKSFYFRLCSKALVKIEDIAHHRVDRLKTSLEDARQQIDLVTGLVLNAQGRGLVSIGFRYNAAKEARQLKKTVYEYWKKGHDSQYQEAADRGYQDRTWRARPWHSSSEDLDHGAHQDGI